MRGAESLKASGPRHPAAYYTVAQAKGAPRLDPDKPILCAWRADSQVQLHLQCDPTARRCLVAEAALFKLAPDPVTGQERLLPTGATPAHMGYCAEHLDAEQLRDLQDVQGYRMTPALLEVPYGYARDERHRALQTHFDLRSRLLLGVHYHHGSQGPSLSVETRSTYEHWSFYGQSRHRLRFLEGQLTLSELRAQLTALEYDYGRTSEEPLLFFGLMIGEPRRYDAHLGLGLGTTLGRVHMRPFEGTRQVFMDLVEARLHWELLQGLALEDYLMIRVGGGLGTRRYTRGSPDVGATYAYPEASLKAAWLISPRGLGQLAMDARVRQAWEQGSGASWRQALASASAEWVVLTVSDQPLSLYAQPELEWLQMTEAGATRATRELRVMAGLRISLFAPPPPPPHELRARQGLDD